MVVNVFVNIPEEDHTEIPELPSNVVEVSVDDILGMSVKMEGLEVNQLDDIRSLVGEFQGLFTSRPGKTDQSPHDTELTSSTPVKSKPYRVSPRQRNLLETEINRMLELGVTKPRESDYMTAPLP